MVACEKNEQLTVEDDLVLGLLARRHDDLSEVVVARQVRSEELRREFLDEVDAVRGAVARVRRCHPAHLLDVVAVLRQAALVDADPLESGVALLHVALAALDLRDLVERLDDLLADLPRRRVEADALDRLVLALGKHDDDRASVALAAGVVLLVLDHCLARQDAVRQVLAGDLLDGVVRGTHVDVAHAEALRERVRADERRRLARASRSSAGRPPLIGSTAARRSRRGRRLRRGEELEGDRVVRGAHLQTHTWLRSTKILREPRLRRKQNRCASARYVSARTAPPVPRTTAPPSCSDCVLEKVGESR